MEIETEVSNLRAFVIGNPASGKTTLINTLVGRASSPSPKKGDIAITLWKPVPYSQDNNERIGATGNAVEFWDLPGSPLFQCLHNVYFTKGTVYLLLVAADCESPDSVVADLWKDITLKIPESKIIIVLTKVDSKSSRIGQTVETIKANILNRLHQEQARLLRGNTAGGNNTSQAVSVFVKTFLKITEGRHTEGGSILILPLSCTNQQGISELKQILTELAHETEVETEHNLVNIPGLSEHLKLVLKKRKENIIFLKYSALEVLENKENTDDCIAYLHDKGAVLDLQQTFIPKKDRYICIDAVKFANILNNSHLDVHGKTFRLEATKFWPKENGITAPNPVVLAGILEDVQAKGFVPEPLFPLLWNTPYMRQDQIKIILETMQRLGLTFEQEHLYIASNWNFELPYFRYLSVNTRHYLASMDKLDCKTPALHWTSFLLKGDVQITVSHKHYGGLPLGMQHRIPIICRNAYSETPHYFHIWNSGVLVRLQEVNIYAESHKDRTDVTVRVNSDFFADIKSVNQVLWVTAAPCLQDLNLFFRSWPGLQIEIEFESRGDMQNNKKGRWDSRFSLQQILNKRQYGIELPGSNVIMPFEVDTTVCDMESWLALVLTKRKEVLQQYLPEALTAKLLYPVPEKQDKMLKKSVKKNLKVRWDLGSVEEKSAMPLPIIQVDGVSVDPSGQDLDAPKTSDSSQRVLPVKDKGDNQNNNNINEQHMTSVSVQESHKSHIDFDENLAYKIASSFVAAILATGTMAFMESENQEESNRWTPAQVSAAKHTAMLATSTWKGDLDAASSAIMNMTSSVGNGKQKECITFRQTTDLSQSKVCHIL